ncbi:MAG: hypothetical protein HY788_14535 [Deltaproteobacteria bacterium]|nr:hypothetical protein [Deltaproteobacteria bacterium]
MFTKSDGKVSSEDLLYRELVCLLVLLIACILVSVLWAAPFESAPGSSEEETAPWFFAGIQELLKHFPAWLVGLVFPALLLAFWAALPFFRRSPSAEDDPLFKWRLPEVRAFLLTMVLLGVLTVWGYW